MRIPADGIGLGLVAALATVAVASDLKNDGDARPVVLSLAFVAVMYVIGRGLAPAAEYVAVGIVSLLVLGIAFAPSSLQGGPLAAPLGYANANAALYVQVMTLLALISSSTRSKRSRSYALTGVAAFFVLTIISGSAAGVIGGALVLGALASSSVAHARTSPHRWSGLALGELALAITATIYLALAYRSGNSSRVAEALTSALNERRVHLWSDALGMLTEHPALGIGPGNFDILSLTARETGTLQTHSLPLQIGSELGLAAAILAVLLLAWTIVRPVLKAEHVRTRADIITIAGSTAFALHCTVDYVASFAAVTGLAALVLGLGVSTRYGFTWLRNGPVARASSVP